jgi:hypothetical protein
MIRFRLYAIVVILLVVVLAASDLSGKGGKGGGGKKGGGHKSAPHRAAPKVHSAHHAGPKPNRVAHKAAPHHAGHPANKQAHHPSKPKGPVKVSKPEQKHKDPGKKEPSKKDPGKNDHGKKDPGKNDHSKKGPGKESGKPATPSHNPKTSAKHPQDHKEANKKEANKRPDDKHRDRDHHFVGRRHAAVHHFAHFDHHHHWYSFDRHWWHNFVDYPNSCDDGQDLPGDYFADGGDQGPWVNYEAMVPPENVQAEPPPVIKVGQSMPISRAGAMLAGRLDGMDVENHWLPGQDVSWKTGNQVDDVPGPASNGCEFVAAVCARLKVVMAEPAPENFFPDRQYNWLVNEGTGSGWVALDGAVEAQLLANQGWVVIAAWKLPTAGNDRTTDGQTAIVHPTGRPVEAVADRGPQITVAGPQNHNDVALKDSFPPAAWDQMLYLACRPRW